MFLAAFHAARPGQIRTLNLDDADLAKRRIAIAGNSRPLDYTCHLPVQQTPFPNLGLLARA